MKLHHLVVNALKCFFLLAFLAAIATPNAPAQMQVYGLWHCYQTFLAQCLAHFLHVYLISIGSKHRRDDHPWSDKYIFHVKPHIQ